MEETGCLLLPNAICRRAKQRAIVKLRHWLVGDHGLGAVPRYVTGGHVYTLCRIVESPFEFNIRRVGVNDALNLGSLVFCDAIHTGLVRCTRRCI